MARLRILALLAGLGFAAPAQAALQIDASSEGCSRLALAGVTTAPFLELAVYHPDDPVSLFHGSVPVAASGEFELSAKLRKKYPRGTVLFYNASGANSGTLGDLDGANPYERILPCDGVPKRNASCETKVASAWAGLIVARNQNAVRCLARVAAGKSNPTCFQFQPTDSKHPVIRARAKIAATLASPICAQDPVPQFGFIDAQSVIDATEAGSLFAQSGVFGIALDIADKATDPADAACQGEAMRQLAKLENAYAKAARKAIQSAFVGSKRAGDPVQTVEELAQSVYLQIEDDAGWSHARVAMFAPLAKACGPAPSSARFSCGGITSTGQLADCLEEVTYLGMCNAIRGSLGVSPSICIY